MPPDSSRMSAHVAPSDPGPSAEIGLFLLGVGVQRAPSKRFTDEGEAIAWLVRYAS